MLELEYGRVVSKNTLLDYFVSKINGRDELGNNEIDIMIMIVSSVKIIMVIIIIQG